tara:strand:- start:146 stop:304 length:159 start_codon:yes stop_codon:yes gene_type:complete
VIVTIKILSDYLFYKTDDDVTKRPHPDDDALSSPQSRRLLKAIEEKDDSDIN